MGFNSGFKGLTNCAICASRCSDSHTVPVGVSGSLPFSLQFVLRLPHTVYSRIQSAPFFQF